MLHPACLPACVAYLAPQDPPPSHKPLKSKDRRLESELPATTEYATLKDLSSWVRKAVKVSIGTTEVEFTTTRDYFILNHATVGDTMEAYSLLYRARWTRYRNGGPEYELGLAKDAIDGLFLPVDESQKQRFAYTRSFVEAADRLSQSDRDSLFSGQPIPVGALPAGMKDSILGAVRAIAAANGTPESETPTLDGLAGGHVAIRDDSVRGSGVRNLWFSVDFALGGFSFRWNDYDREKTVLPSPRPTIAVADPLPNEAFSKKKMIEGSRVLNTRISVAKSKYRLTELAKYLSDRYPLNFVLNRPKEDTEREVSIDDLPLHRALDLIAKVYDELEWESSPGNFIVLRSSDNPRRRNLAASN